MFCRYDKLGNVGAEHAEGAGKWTHRAFGGLFWGIPVHNNHDIFIQGIEQKRSLKLEYFYGKNLRKLVRKSAPLHYSKGRNNGDGLSCYYFWIFKPEKDSSFLALPPSQIVTMELTGETFSIEDIENRQREKYINK